MPNADSGEISDSHIFRTKPLEMVCQLFTILTHTNRSHPAGLIWKLSHFRALPYSEFFTTARISTLILITFFFLIIFSKHRSRQVLLHRLKWGRLSQRCLCFHVHLPLSHTTTVASFYGMRPWYELFLLHFKEKPNAYQKLQIGFEFDTI